MTAMLPSLITSISYIPHPTDTTKAARWMVTRKIQVGLLPKPIITDPSDTIIQTTYCTICGSDLHMYEGDLKDIMERTISSATKR